MTTKKRPFSKHCGKRIKNAGNQHTLLFQNVFYLIIDKKYYSTTCIQRPLKGNNGSSLLQQVVFKCRFYLVELRRVVVSEQWSLKAGGLLIQVVSNTGLTVS